MPTDPRAISTRPVRVGFRCDVAPHRGIGHVMRSIALAEEFTARGAIVSFCCDAHTVAWAAGQLAARGYPVRPAVWTGAEHRAWAVEEDLDLVVFDSYDLDTEAYATMRGHVVTAAFVDGDLRGADADVLVDQNLGSESDHPELPPGTLRLAGLDFVMFRDSVLARRPERAPDVRAAADPPAVLAFFGGTDAFGAGPVLTRAMVATGLPFDLQVVAPGDLADEVAAAAATAGPGQRVRPIAPTDDLPELITAADVVLAAAGTSTWELMCLGAVAGLVCVVDNQEIGYERAVATGAAAGVGRLDDLRADPAATTSVLRTLLTDTDRRSGWARAGWSLVDGRGRVRVADELLGRVRRAAGADARLTSD